MARITDKTPFRKETPPSLNNSNPILLFDDTDTCRNKNVRCANDKARQGNPSSLVGVGRKKRSKCSADDRHENKGSVIREQQSKRDCQIRFTTMES